MPSKPCMITRGRCKTVQIAVKLRWMRCWGASLPRGAIRSLLYCESLPACQIRFASKS